MSRICVIAASLLLAGCAAAAPAAAPSPAAPARPAPGDFAPDFRLPLLGGPGDMSLRDALNAKVVQRGGAVEVLPARAVVLVLSSSDCEWSRKEHHDLAAALGPAGDPAFRVLVVLGGPGEAVEESLPPQAPFDVVRDAAGRLLDRWQVKVTPDVVVLYPSGQIAYLGPGGYLAPAKLVEMARKAARNEPLDPGVKPDAG